MDGKADQRKVVQTMAGLVSVVYHRSAPSAGLTTAQGEAMMELMRLRENFIIHHSTGHWNPWVLSYYVDVARKILWTAIQVVLYYGATDSTLTGIEAITRRVATDLGETNTP